MDSPKNQAERLVVYTMGCRANQYQSFALECQISNDKCQIVRFGDEADIYIINTCTVTLDAERKSRQAIRRALRFGKKVVVTGCLARIDGEKLQKLYPEIIITHLPPLPLGEGEQKGVRAVRVRENLMIEDGCENFCSYCIVPHARGKVVRKPEKDIIEEAKRLAEASAREIVLTGINLGAWGNLSGLLPKLCDLSGSLRVRLSSIEPQYVSDQLIETIAGHPRLCQYLHIPLQSGDDKILKAMNRKYSAEEYVDLIERIRRKIPDCGISTDVIVGFPGETDEQFKNTVRIIEKIGFSRLHIFAYSVRDLTAASKLPDQIDPRVKKQRFKVLEKIGKEQIKVFAEKYLKQEVEILVEQKGEGLTSNYIRVKFDDRHNLTGQLHNLILTIDNLVL